MTWLLKNYKFRPFSRRDHIITNSLFHLFGLAIHIPDIVYCHMYTVAQYNAVFSCLYKGIARL